MALASHCYTTMNRQSLCETLPIRVTNVQLGTLKKLSERTQLNLSVLTRMAIEHGLNRLEKGELPMTNREATAPAK